MRVCWRREAASSESPGPQECVVQDAEESCLWTNSPEGSCPAPAYCQGKEKKVTLSSGLLKPSFYTHLSTIPPSQPPLF